MTSPRWMILVCFSLISVFGTGESLTIIVPEISNEQNSLPAIIAQMSRAIADLNASHKKLLVQQGRSGCNCNPSSLQACYSQRNLANRRLSSCNSQLRSLVAQRSSLLRQVSAFRSQYAAVVKQRAVLQSRLNVFTRYQNYGWKYYRGSFYYVSTSTATWVASRNYCTARGADLVVINDAFENNFTRGLKRKAWIGLYRSGSNWRWVDGSYLSSRASYWAPREPNNLGNREGHVEIRLFNILNSWNDEPWTTANYWICEKKV
ncbi:CD209 antigen-like protein C [Oryzias melastigma]|uniref:CD209 antigen-like protein C n=1 Tax=Oryzias melastigma TaxID=30732 RepID=A0A3B3B7J0_ORYME|nr:CD209 antigen-like protein C [Oryzias melastigma]